MTGIELIALEREEQIKKHGRTLVDDTIVNRERELKKAAVALLTDDESEFPKNWNIRICEKMFNKTYEERLVIAGALIAAEIDRVKSPHNISNI